MANNLDSFVPQLLAQGLLALREAAVMPALVNRAYEDVAGRQGSTVSVPVPSAVTAVAVTPGVTAPANADSVESEVSIPLNEWFEAPFYLTDKEQLQVSDGFFPSKASEAIRSLANNVDRFVLDLGKKFYGFHGTPGTAPFALGGAEVTSATGCRKVLNQQLAPLSDRRLVVDPSAEANMLGLRAFHDASFGVGAGAILRGEIGPRLGFLNAMDQNVRTHTAGTGAGYLVNNGGGYAAGTKTVALDTGTGTVLVGDVITFAGHAQTYVVTSGTSGVGPISFEPGLVTAVADNAAVTLKATHVMNLAFHRDAIAFASRPLVGSRHPSAIISSAVDPVSGLALRLEITRQHKQDRFSFDILYGAEVVRRELGMRLAG